MINRGLNKKQLADQTTSGAIILPRCHICNEVPMQGIRGGIRLKKTFICNACEQQLVRTEVASDNYLRILAKLKEIFK